MGMRDTDGLSSSLKSRLSSILGSLVIKGNETYYLYNNKQYPVKITSVGLNSQNVNQLSAIDLKFHIIGKETISGYEYVVLNPYHACVLATTKSPQHNGIVIENFACTYKVFSQYNKLDDSTLEKSLEASIKTWESHKDKQVIESYMESQKFTRFAFNQQNIDFIKAIM